MKNTLMLAAILMSFSVNATPKQHTFQIGDMGSTNTLEQGNVIPLTNGNAIKVSGAWNSVNVYSIDITEGATDLVITTKGGSGDVDLYGGTETDISNNKFTCISEEDGTDETCTIKSPDVGMYYVALYGYDSYSGVELKAAFDDHKGGCSATGNAGSFGLFALMAMFALFTASKRK